MSDFAQGFLEGIVVCILIVWLVYLMRCAKREMEKR